MRSFSYICSIFAISFMLIVILSSCGAENSSQGNTQTETTSTGNVTIAIDETLMPVFRQQLNVFDSSFPDAHIKPVYTTEQQCVSDLFNDSVKLIITTRELTEKEAKAFALKEEKIRTLAIAKDAIAVIANNAASDSFMTLGQLQQIMLGKFARKYTIVFDNASSSIVRYMLDSLLAGKPLPTQSYGIANTDSLIDYVAKNKDAIGFVGVTHIYDKNSSKPEGEFLSKINVVSLKNEKDTTINDFYQPYQAWIALNKYPLSRSIYFITKDNFNGLSAGFANFISRQEGQLIFKTARLVPLRVPLQIREATIKP